MPRQPSQTIASYPRKRAYSVKEAAREISVSVAQIYNLLNLEKLRGKKAGGRLIILGEAIDEYIASLPPYKGGTPAHLVGVKRGRRPKHQPQAAPQKSGRVPGKRAGEARAASPQ
jgi:hypothetical protein